MKRFLGLLMCLVLLAGLTGSVMAQEKVYLPQVTTGITSKMWVVPPCSADHVASLAQHIDTSHPVDTPDAWRAGCLLPSVQVSDNPDPLNPPGAFLADPRDVAAASAQPQDWQISKKLGVFRLDCNTACQAYHKGITWIEGALIVQPVSLLSGTWDQHFYGLWLAVASSNGIGIECANGYDGRAHISVGIGTGRFSSATYVTSGYYIFWDRYNDGSCSTFVNLTYAVPSTVGTGIRLYMVGEGATYTQWSAMYWANSTWNYIFQNETLYVPSVDYAMAAAEVGDVSGAHTHITGVESNVIAGLRIATYGGSPMPWANHGPGTFGSWALGKTTEQWDAPVRRLGVIADNFTSNVSSIIP